MEQFITLLEISVGGGLAITILLIVFKFLKTRSARNGLGVDERGFLTKALSNLEDIQVVINKVLKDVEIIKSENHDLHVWHDVHDNEGVKLWYVRKSLEQAIEKLADNIGEQSKMFRDFFPNIVSELTLMKDKVQTLSEKMK